MTEPDVTPRDHRWRRTLRLRGSAVTALSGVGSLLIARVIAGASTLGLFAVLARVLTTDQFGLFGLAWSLSYVFAALAEGGYGMLVVREVAQAPKQAGFYLGASVPLRLAFALVVLIGAGGISATVGWESPVAIVLLAAAAANLQLVSGLPRDFLMGTDRTEWAALHAVMETILRTSVIIGAGIATHSIAAIFVAAALFHLAWTLANLPVVWKVFHPSHVLAGARSWGSVLVRSLPFGAFTVLDEIYGQMDVVVVSALMPLASVAMLQVAVRILLATDYAPEAAWRWAFPRLSRSAGADMGVFIRQVTRFATGLMTLGLFAAIVLLISAPWMIPLLFGARYAPAVLPMQLVAAAIPLRYGAHVYGTALSAAGLQVVRARLFFLVIVVAVLVEAILILPFGLVGAAIGIVLSSALLLASYFAAARRAWGRAMDARPILALGAFAAVSVVAVALR